MVKRINNITHIGNLYLKYSNLKLKSNEGIWNVLFDLFDPRKLTLNNYTNVLTCMIVVVLQQIGVNTHMYTFKDGYYKPETIAQYNKICLWRKLESSFKNSTWVYLWHVLEMSPVSTREHGTTSTSIWSSMPIYE